MVQFLILNLILIIMNLYKGEMKWEELEGATVASINYFDSAWVFHEGLCCLEKYEQAFSEFACWLLFNLLMAFNLQRKSSGTENRKFHQAAGTVEMVTLASNDPEPLTTAPDLCLHFL